MLETIAVWIIILFCFYFIMKRFYLRWKAANDNKAASCLDDCSCCSDASCNKKTD